MEFIKIDKSYNRKKHQYEIMIFGLTTNIKKCFVWDKSLSYIDTARRKLEELGHKIIGLDFERAGFYVIVIDGLLINKEVR